MINNQLHPHFSRNYNSPNSFQGKLCFNQLFDQPMPELDPKFKEIVSKDWTEEISKIKTSQTTDQESCKVTCKDMEEVKSDKQCEIFIDGNISDDSVEMIDDSVELIDIDDKNITKYQENNPQKSQSKQQSCTNQWPDFVSYQSTADFYSNISLPSDECLKINEKLLNNSVDGKEKDKQEAVIKKAIKPRRTTIIELVVEPSQFEADQIKPTQSVNDQQSTSISVSSNILDNSKFSSSSSNYHDNAQLTDIQAICDDPINCKRKNLQKNNSLYQKPLIKRKKRMDEFDVVGNILRLSDKTFAKNQAPPFQL